MKIKHFLKKVQNLPEGKRKVILWAIVIIIGLGLVTLWAVDFRKTLREFRKEEFIEKLNLPQLEEEMKGLPSIEIPELSEEELKKLEEEMKKLEEENEEAENSTPDNQPQ